ncbi:hypothetical protein G6045_26560 [Streptomyces sp. YC504]|uniref:Uncharacterized protein n=1 Tax=Streptomyces mesophilus TaxID=1775132 RepID=A0A6G4XQU8_9ACTN|nr:hypothetical protein [Streptomyces mesophilus]NGO79187.1 hypothetical protein [Streptomyces mesophilus]
MNEGVAAILAALIAVGGVGLGLVGARWQYRGALEQANAAVKAAQEQAQAAIEAVKAQGRDQNAQWRRTVRRDVWIDFIAVVAALQNEIDEVDGFLMRQDYQAAIDAYSVVNQRWLELHRPIGAIELEGPEEIIERALRVRNAYNTAKSQMHIDANGQLLLLRVRAAADGGDASALRFFEAAESIAGSESQEERHRVRLEVLRNGIDGFSPQDVFSAFNLAASQARWDGDMMYAIEEMREFVAAARRHLDGEDPARLASATPSNPS